MARFYRCWKLMPGRLMSDYEVTLVNDNSKLSLILGTAFTDNAPSVRSAASNPSPRSPQALLTHDRQEFYVRFKGPEESME